MSQIRNSASRRLYRNSHADMAIAYPNKDEDIKALVHPRDRFYAFISTAIGIFFYLLLFLCLAGFVVVPVFAILACISGFIRLGNVRSRGIRVSERQFPELFNLLKKLTRQLEVEQPEVYIVNEMGLQNAFVDRVVGRNYMVLYSDILEIGYKHGREELAFILGHELAHLKCAHLRWEWLHLPASIIPFFGNAFSRAREYTCDRIAQHLSQDGSLYGLVALASGNELLHRVNLEALYEQADADWNFWTWLHEIQSSHPNLVNRIQSLGISASYSSTVPAPDEIRGRNLRRRPAV